MKRTSKKRRYLAKPLADSCLASTLGGWVDPATNWAYIPGLSPAAPWQPPTDADSRSLSSLLHEMTHHWCFTSTLGEIIAIQSALVWEELNVREMVGGKPSAWLADLQILLESLRAFSEGLALFAEFDWVNGADDSTELTPLTAIVKAIYGNNWDAVRFQKNSIHTLQHKTAVLRQSFLSPGGHGYGYALVKVIRAKLLQRVPELASNPDLLLSYSKSFVFDDPSWAVQTLPKVNGRDTEFSSSRIPEYLERRLDCLANNITHEMVEEFTSLGPQASNLLIDPAVFEEGRALLNDYAIPEYYDELTSDVDKSPTLASGSDFIQFLSGLLERRRFLLLAQELDSVVLREGVDKVTAQLERGGSVTLPRLQESEGKYEDNSMELFAYLGYSRPIVGAIIVGGRRSVALKFIGEPDPEEAARIKGYLRDMPMRPFSKFQRMAYDLAHGTTNRFATAVDYNRSVDYLRQVRTFIDSDLGEVEWQRLAKLGWPIAFTSPAAYRDYIKIGLELVAADSPPGTIFDAILADIEAGLTDTGRRLSWLLTDTDRSGPHLML